MTPTSCILQLTYYVSMLGLSDFRHRLHVATCPAIYQRFFIEKTQKCKTCQNPNNLAWSLIEVGGRNDIILSLLAYTTLYAFSRDFPEATKLGSSWLILKNKVVPHKKMNEFRPNACCVTSDPCFRVFHRENPRKCIKCHKINMACMLAMVMPMREQIWVCLVEVKKVLRDMPCRPTWTVHDVHGVLATMHEMTSTFASMWACPR